MSDGSDRRERAQTLPDPAQGAAAPSAHRMSMVMAALSSGALGVFMLLPDAPDPWRMALLGLALVAFLVLVLVLPRAGRSAPAVLPVIVLSGVLLVVAVVARPNGTDLWYYQMYGRIVVEHRANPYEHTPAEYPNDPVRARTGGFWDGVRAEYGPVLIALAAGVAWVTGTSELAARLVWQGLAALAVFLALVLVARRTRNGVAVAIIGLNPVVAYSVVNAGHNDALVGLAILGGVMLATRDRYILAAIAMTAATLVKAPVGVALVALLVWIAWRRGVRSSIAPAATAAGITLFALLASGGRAALSPMLGAAGRTNRLTPWNVFRSGGLDPFRGRGNVALGPLPDVGPWLAVIACVGLAAVLVASRLHEREPTLAVGSAVAAWLLLALYVSPWSLFWVLPVLALRRTALVTRSLLALVPLALFTTEWGAMADGAAWSSSPNADLYQHVLAYLVSVTIVATIAVTIALLVQAIGLLRRQLFGPELSLSRAGPPRE